MWGLEGRRDFSNRVKRRVLEEGESQSLDRENREDWRKLKVCRRLRSDRFGSGFPNVPSPLVQPPINRAGFCSSNGTPLHWEYSQIWDVKVKLAHTVRKRRKKVRDKDVGVGLRWEGRRRKIRLQVPRRNRPSFVCRRFSWWGRRTGGRPRYLSYPRYGGLWPQFNGCELGDRPARRRDENEPPRIPLDFGVFRGPR